MAKLTCYGGAGSTTGANFMLEFESSSTSPRLRGTTRILVDCGMEQGGEKAHLHNQKKFEYDPASVEILFVTHAHIDHIGLIPKLVREGFKGEIYSTEATKNLAALLLMDAVKIGRDNKESLYTSEDVERSLGLWKTLVYHEPKNFGGFTVELFNAGHILGSAMYKFISGGKSMLFTGDLGNSPSSLLPDMEKVSGLDYLLIESVYGDRNHEHKELREEKFKKVMIDAIARGGTLLIPAFSMERTQEILARLDNLFESKELPFVPVYLDSPLAQKITAIYERAGELLNENAQKEIAAGDDLFKFRNLHESQHMGDSRAIAAVPGPKIIIAGSGMSTAGRIVGHEVRYLPQENSTILFMGYQAIGTLGRQISEGVKKVMIDDTPVEVRARIEKIDGFSGHADSNALVNFVEESQKTLKKVFVGMGEPRSAIFLSQRIRDELGVEAIALEEGKSYEFDF